MTSKGVKFNLTRHCDTLTIPLILKKSLKIRLYAVFKRPKDSDLKLYHKEEP